MKFHLFEAMSKEEAQEYLESFLAFGRDRGMEILEDGLHFTVDLDFSIESLPKVVKGLLPLLKTVPREPDPRIPGFIRQTEEYEKNLFDFDESSNLIILSAAYYLGEAFVRNFIKLRWTTGNTDYLQGNMPVIVPFKYKKELPPILIAENSFRKGVSSADHDTSIDIAIEAWKESLFD